MASGEQLDAWFKGFVYLGGKIELFIYAVFLLELKRLRGHTQLIRVSGGGFWLVESDGFGWSHPL